MKPPSSIPTSGSTSPGHLSGFAPDLVKITDDAAPDAGGLFAPRDIVFTMEVVSRSTTANDYGP